MKILAFLPFAFSNRIPEYVPQNDELKFGHSLCESDECPHLDGRATTGVVIISDDISSTSCSSEYKSSFLSGRMDRCEYYNASHSDCVKWAKQELESACGGDYNCAETKRSSIGGYGAYWGVSSK